MSFPAALKCRNTMFLACCKSLKAFRGAQSTVSPQGCRDVCTGNISPALSNDKVSHQADADEVVCLIGLEQMVAPRDRHVQILMIGVLR